MQIDKSDQILREFILDCGLPLQNASAALGIKPSQVMDWWSNRKNFIDKTHVRNLSQYLGISEDSIYQKTYDKNLVRNRIFSGPAALPKRYNANKYSHVRTSAHIIKYLQASRGQHFADQLLQSMNVSPLIYEDLNNQINLTFFIDLLENLKKLEFSDLEMDTLAGLMFLGLENTQLGRKFQNAETYYKCYQVLAENTTEFDTNFVYTSELSKNEFRITAFLSNDLLKSLNLNKTNLNQLMKYRKNMFEWFPYLSNMAPLRATTISRSDRLGDYITYILPYERNITPLFAVPDTD